MKKLELKINMECVVKILEKNGYKIENLKDVEVGSPITAKKEITSKNHEKVELFQVRCGPPYMKFEAKVYDNIQQGMIDALNQGLNNFLKGAEKRTAKESKK
jgi:hypothetical protein